VVRRPDPRPNERGPPKKRDAPQQASSAKTGRVRARAALGSTLSWPRALLRNPLTTRFRPGDILADRYRIERELGRGGMAVVYLAHDAKHERSVALKILSDELSSAVGADRFRQEIKLTASLQHPHILPAYDSGVTDDGTLFYVMPFVEGGSLRQRLDAEKRLPIADVIRVTREVTDALAYAHERGVVHRDIKPENVLFLGGHALIADFGIARLMTVETVERLTVQGAVVGTPAYMSPEQGLAMPVDARSDIYSLACVVYEMLTGAIPFSGPGGGAWVDNRLARAPAPVRLHRPEVSESLQAVVVRALAPSPNDRHQTVREFADALQQAAPARRRDVGRAWRGGILAGSALALVAIIGTAALTTSWLSDSLISLGVVKLDSSRVFVAPVQATDAATGSIAASLEQKLHDELDGWDGVNAPSASAVRDAIGDTSTPLTLDRALAAARRSRAGLVLWGRTEQTPRGPAFEARLYDARSAANRAEAVMLLSNASDSIIDAASQLAVARLFAGTEAPRTALRAAGSTRSLLAWTSYVDGHRALDDWRLARAETAFTASAFADPRFPQPRAWLAQTLIWNRRGARSEWRRHADAALMFAGRLDSAALHVARATAALARQEEPAACAEYAGMIARDSLDAAAWLGLGDCHALDSVVVRDARSPSGFASRGNLHRAMTAYERAVRLAPGAHAALPFGFIERVLITRSDRYRHGVQLGDDTRQFAARPSLVGDSVAYVPRPIIANTLPPDPPNFEEALNRNRARLFDYVSGWVQRAPASADAYEALAAVQEARAELAPRAGAAPSALAALDSARRRSADPEARARVDASRIRVLLKLGEFDRLRALADSLLGAPRPTPREAHWLAGIAALTGRAADASRLARLGGAPPVDWDTLPAALVEPAVLLLVHAALGVCGDDFTADIARVESLIDSYVPPAHRGAARVQLMHRARYLAVPCLGTTSVASEPAHSMWDRMNQSLARGDTAGVRAGFDSLMASRRFRQVGSTSLDFTFQEAWLLAAIGDTAGAIRHLDLTLNALPTLNRNATWELAQSASVGRAMVWRADLARALGDVQNASRWAGAVLALWGTADAELRPAIGRMQMITGSR